MELVNYTNKWVPIEALKFDHIQTPAYFQTGQRCTASSRLVVTGGIHDRFVDALTVRPFLSDLRRMRRATQGLRLVAHTDEEILRDTANAA